ncbi:MAG: hypothetical protein K8I27_13160 [Planctomycetes bacterium]|nr:hypothetical protein [Planctomycetota bacterium]
MKRAVVGIALVLALAAVGVSTWYFWSTDENQGENASGSNASREEDRQDYSAQELALADDLTVDNDRMLEIAKYENLQVLNLRGCSAPTDAGLAAIGSLKKLETLDLHKTGVGAESAKAIGSLTKLSTLDLSQCDNLRDEHLPHLSDLPLTTLNLSGCANLTDKGIEHIARIETLETLDLSWCPRITGAGLKALEKLPKLRELRLNNAPWSDGAITSASFATLELLDLRETPRLTTQAAEDFQNRHPNCKVLR